MTPRNADRGISGITRQSPRPGGIPSQTTFADAGTSDSVVYGAHWVTMLLISVGAIAVVLASLPYKSFELDRHFVPKEIALHVTATLAAITALVHTTRLRITRIDSLLITFLALSALSGLFAPNWWNAGRTLGMSVSSVLLFWAASVAGRGRLRSPLFLGLTIAMVLGVATALAQAYGVVGDYASLSRAPGGTFGNRNFMAHLAVICTPILIYLTVRAQRRAWIGLMAITAVSGALVLSRSRAAWLALLVGGVLCLPALWSLRAAARRTTENRSVQSSERSEQTTGITRIVAVALAVAIGVAGALFIPNRLEWKSDSPYLDSVRSVVNYKEGSGRGRMIQYKRTALLTLRHPLLGVGTGNWAVVYPTVAPGDDPSLVSDGRTANPWPSSDWMAIVSERGIPAFLCFAITMLGMLMGAVHRWHTADSVDERGAALVLGATVLITLIVGSFDAVLSIAIPALFVWVIAGALIPRERSRREIALPMPKRALAMVVVLIIGGTFATRSVLQATAMSLFEEGSGAAMRRAVELDPGNYRIQLKLAALAEQRGQCARVKRYGQAAHALFPDASQPVQLLHACGINVQ